MPLDGRSLVPLLNGNHAQPDWPERLIFARTAGWRTVLSFTEPVVKDLQTLGKTVRSNRWRATNEGKGWELCQKSQSKCERSTRDLDV